MVKGEVNADQEAVVALELIGRQGQRAFIRAVIDTGFSDMLSLPPALVTSLGMQLLGTQAFELADESQVEFDLYDGASVVWDGSQREVTVVEADGNPLVGMMFLRHHRLIIDIIDGGDVIVERL